MTSVNTNMKTSRLYANRNKWGVLFAMPAILGFFIFIFAPMISSLGLSFFDYNFIKTPFFIGFENYDTLLNNDPNFYKSAVATIQYLFMSTPLLIITSFLIALALSEKLKGIGVFRGLIYIPSIVPIAVAAIAWQWIYSTDFGFANQFLGFFNIPKVKWLSSKDNVIMSLSIVRVWQLGPMMVIFLAGIKNVPRYLYEAIEIDGGNYLHKLWYITLPMVSSTIFFNLIMGIVGAMQMSAEVFMMTRGGPNYSSAVMVFFVVQKAFNEMMMGYGSAVAWFMFIFIFVFYLLVFMTQKKWVYYESER